MGAVGLFSHSFTPVHTPLHTTSSSMADVSDSRLADAYAAVRSDSDPTTWAVAGYDKDAKDKIVLEATGTGNLDELAGHFCAAVGVVFEERDACGLCSSLEVAL